MKLTPVIVGLLTAFAAAFSALNYFQSPARGASPPKSLASSVSSSEPLAGPGQSLCIMNDIKADHCKEGELAWFMPSRWGNDQLPIAFAAAVCDFHHPIVWNNGGVACVYTQARRAIPAAGAAGGTHQRPRTHERASSAVDGSATP